MLLYMTVADASVIEVLIIAVQNGHLCIMHTCMPKALFCFVLCTAEVHSRTVLGVCTHVE